MGKRVLALAAAAALGLAAFGVRSAAKAKVQEQAVLSAQLGLQALAQLQHAYQQRTGTFAPDVGTLLKASGREAEFMQVLPQAIDMTTLKFEVEKDSFSIEASALDRGRTRIRVHNAR